jgi:hypothetical protein
MAWTLILVKYLMPVIHEYLVDEEKLSMRLASSSWVEPKPAPHLNSISVCLAIRFVPTYFSHTSSLDCSGAVCLLRLFSSLLCRAMSCYLKAGFVRQELDRLSCFTTTQDDALKIPSSDLHQRQSLPFRHSSSASYLATTWRFHLHQALP